MSDRLFFKRDWLNAVDGDANGDAVLIPFLAGAKDDGVAIFGAPEVRVEDEAVLEVVGARIVGTVDRVTMQHGEEFDHLGPIAFEETSV